MYDAGSMTVWVKAKTEYGCADSAYTVITQTEPPTITLLSGSDWVGVATYKTMTEIKYVTTVADGATVSGLPPGVSGAWSMNTYTISGAPTQTGTFPYTVTTTNAHGCIDASATGTIMVATNCVPASFTLGTVAFANVDTYTRNGIILSAPVTASGCNKTTYAGGTSAVDFADCRSNPGYDGDLFSWCMVVMYAAQLCPSPWRAPTHQDFCMYVNGSPTDRSAATDLFAGVHGWTLSGSCNNAGVLQLQGTRGNAWATTRYDSTWSYTLYFGTENLHPASYTSPYHGFSLRCVQ
jgi:hypothetical protein